MNSTNRGVGDTQKVVAGSSTFFLLYEYKLLEKKLCQASKCLYEGFLVYFLDNKFQPMQRTVMIPTRLAAVYRSL